VRKILALVERDLRRVIRSKGFLVLAVIQPLAYVGIFALILGRQMEGMQFAGRLVPYVAFMIPGMMALQTNQQFQIQLSLSSGDRRWGILLVSSIAGMRPLQYVGAQIVSRSLLAGVQAILIVAMGVLVIDLPIPSGELATRLALASVAWLSSVCFWTSMGILVGIQILNETTRDVVWSLLNLPVMFTSSVFYDVEQAPRLIAVASRANPLTHCADVLRAALLGHPRSMISSVVLLAALALVALLAAMFSISRSSLLGRKSG
jgi:ABC-2 type transport system permease protein